MKHSRFFGFAAGAAMLLSASVAHADMRYSRWLPPTHQINTVVLDPFFAELAERTDGRVTIEATPKVVGSVAEQFEVVRDGLADVAVMVPGYSVGRFPLTEFADLPFLSGQGESASGAAYDLYMDHFAKFGEFDGVKILALFQVGASHVFNTVKPLTSMEDFNGLKLRVATETGGKTAEALGAIPLHKPASELYQMVASGVADGGMVPLEAMKSFKFAEVAKYETIFEGGLYSALLVVVMNERSYDKLSDEDKAIVDELSGKTMSMALGKSYDDANAAGIEELRAKGVEINVASPEFVAEAREVTEPIRQAWIEKVEKLGVEDAATLLDQYLAQVEAEDYGL